MKTTDVSFDLPQELIAQHPSRTRGDSRLMLLERTTGRVRHHTIHDLPRLLPPGAVMVFNDSRVRKARLYARPEHLTEAREFLLVRDVAPDLPGSCWEAMTRRPGRLRSGTRVRFPADRAAEVIGHREMFVLLRFEHPLNEEYFAAHGHVPLPPYISREDDTDDEQRYQTVYAREPGSVAAPTAGLHFTPQLLDRIAAEGVTLEWVRLHVGIGTFLPVRVDDLDDHRMHEEECELDGAVAERLNAVRAAGRPLVAVGTTTVRTLEAAFDHELGRLVGFRGTTDLFIRPGHRFGAVDAMFTNFHTPRSTLLMLVSAFAGREQVLSAYRQAVEQRYRFFSYGDAMLIL